MVSFTKCLGEAIRPEWSSNYVNYAALKRLLQDLALGNKSEYFGEPSLTSESMDGDDERVEMCKALDDELFKVQIFSMTMKRILQQKVINFKKESLTLSHSKISDEETKRNFHELLHEIIEFHIFVGVNTVTLYHLLIRYDSMARLLLWSELGQWYIVTRRGKAYGCLLDALERKALMQLEDELLILGTQILVGDTYIENIRLTLSKIDSVITNAEENIQKVVELRRHNFTDNILGSMFSFLKAGSYVTHITNIRTIGTKLHSHIKFFSECRMDLISNNSENAIPTNEYQELDSKNRLKDIMSPSLILILFAQLFYMMNHYIVEPSSVQYIHELGGNDALAGLLIGCTPWAALVSAFMYSLWSNVSFKQPLLCAVCFLFMGSFTYANALSFESIPMAMIGRALTGLGAPCGINIRYIADTIRNSERTAMSSLFVMVGAVGMSAGPGLAILLDFFDIDVTLPLFGRFMLNGMTGPGYLMSLVWLIFGINLLLFFKDGERIGISERCNGNHINVPCENYKPPDPKDSDLQRMYNVHESSSQSLVSIDSIDDPPDFSLLDKNDAKKKKMFLNEATVVCMIIKFFSRFCLEILGCSVSIITRYRYDWSVKMIGSLGLSLGLLVIPISAFVGWLSLYYTDKNLLVVLLSVSFFGVSLLVDFSDFNVKNSTEEFYNVDNPYSVSEMRYIVGIIFEFCGFQASQSIVLSILSKVVPLKLATGTFNSGFIATSTITLSRALGDTFITMMGYVSIRDLLNLLSVPALLLSGFSILLAIFHSHKLSV